ncbi:hypothetical protein L0Y65_03020 [Candidatus Micrarchaeota archaeon]|nr:hypothetical protein [Candidatus Micrarchaeota archaeon]
MTNIATKTGRKAPNSEGDIVKMGPPIADSRGFGGAAVLFESGIIADFVDGSGQYVILPKGTKMMNAIRTLLGREIGGRMGFEEITLPKIAPLDTFRKADILGKWDDYLIAATPYAGTRGVADTYLLDPLQCTAVYQFLENREMSAEILPLRWLDCSGPTYRNEDSTRFEALVRQREFHRFELAYIGTREQVIGIREECLARLEALLMELGLGYRISVGSGCYQIRDGELDTPQAPEEIPIKDLEVYCPGREENGAFLEVAGCAVLAATMTSRFKIREKDGNALWSGCTGVGLERMVYALVANHGADSAFFPEMLKGVMA